MDSKVWICPRGVEEYRWYTDSLLQREQVQTRCRGERDHSAAHLCVIGSRNDNNAACLWNALVQPWCWQTGWTRATRQRFQLKTSEKKPYKGLIHKSFRCPGAHFFARAEIDNCSFLFPHSCTWALLLQVEWPFSSLSAWLFLPGAQTALDWSAGH